MKEKMLRMRKIRRRKYSRFLRKTGLTRHDVIGYILIIVMILAVFCYAKATTAIRAAIERNKPERRQITYITGKHDNVPDMPCGITDEYIRWKEKQQ